LIGRPCDGDMLSEKNVFKLKKRREIYDFIDKNPGLNTREISRKLNVPFTSLSYHLKYLKKLDLIIEKHEGKYKKIFISYKISAKDKKILGLLRNKNSCKILLYLFWMFSCSQIELSRELKIPPPTVSYYLKKMINLEIIEENPVVNGRIYPLPNSDRYIEHKPVRSEKFYRRKNQEVADSVYKLLIAYKSSFDKENITDILINLWTNYKAEPNPVTIKKYRKLDDQIDSVADFLNSFFRPPFCA